MELSIAWLIAVVVKMLVIGLIGWLLYYVAGKAPVPDPIKQVAQFIIILVLVLVLIVIVLLPLLNMGPATPLLRK